MLRHSALAPQGDGTHGFVIIGCTVTSGAKLKKKQQLSRFLLPLYATTYEVNDNIL